MAEGDADSETLRQPRRRTRPAGRIVPPKQPAPDTASTPAVQSATATLPPPEESASSSQNPTANQDSGSPPGKSARPSRKPRRDRRSAARPVVSRREKAELVAERRAKTALWSRVLIISLLVNAAIIGALMAIALALPVQPERVLIASAPQQEKPPEARNEILERTRRQHQAASSSASSMDTVLAPAISPIAFTPQFEISEAGDLLGTVEGFDSGVGLAGIGQGSGGGNGDGMIGGIRVRSRRLGVILDVSGSMSDEIREVKKDLKKNFSSATVVEVSGCRLDFDGDDPRFDPAKSKISYKKSAISVTEALEMLIADRRVDAIYWFSDLNDPHTKAGNERLSHLLGTHFGSERRPVIFYVRSVDREVPETLAGIAKRSGGAVKVEKYVIEE